MWSGFFSLQCRWAHPIKIILGHSSLTVSAFLQSTMVEYCQSDHNALINQSINQPILLTTYLLTNLLTYLYKLTNKLTNDLLY